MDIADFIIVSNDSASMLSEALFTGKPVYLIELIGKSKKLNKFQNRLRDSGYIRILGKDDFVSYKYKPIENAKNVASKIEEGIKK
jgi:hypothetical protein